MNVSAAGAGPPDLDPLALKALAGALARTATPLPNLSSGAGAGQDGVSLSMAELTSASLQNLLQVVEDRISQAGVSHHANSVHAAGQPAPGGMANPVVPNLDRITLDARNTAELSVSRAAHAIETAAGAHLHRTGDQPDPQTVILLASQLIQTGQLPNYLRAAEMGRIVVEWYDGLLPISAPVPGALSAARRQLQLREPRPPSQFFARLKSLWRRAPLLILLGGWLMAGLIFGLVARIFEIQTPDTALLFDIWGLGFLGLVGFQFVVTIWRARHR